MLDLTECDVGGANAWAAPINRIAISCLNIVLVIIVLRDNYGNSSCVVSLHV